MKNKSKIINIAVAFVWILALALSVAGISGCGIINFGPDSGDAEDMTFASKNNYDRNDILADAVESPAKPGEKDNINDNRTQTEKIPQVNDTQPENTEETEENENQTDSGADIVETAEPEATKSPEAEESIEKDGTVRLKFIAAGDNIIHLNMIDDAKERAKSGENFNFKDMYKDIASTVKAADIALVNVETPIAGDEFSYDGYPMFNTPKENGFALTDMGFNIINIANNHMLDKWEKGYINNINFWEDQNVLLIGGFKNQEDFENIRIYDKNGVSIAFLSYTYGTNGMVLPADSQMVIPFIDDATVERQVKAARPLADLLFVVMHWGDEDSLTPNQWQRSLAQMMVDNGVDVIIGMHPHVFQETKWVSRPDGKKTLIAYSLGNMISGMLGAKNMIGGLLNFDIVKITKNGESDTTIENVQMIPIITHYNMRRKAFQVYRFDEYTEELAKAHGNINSDNKFSYKYIKDVIIQNIAPEFLSDFYKD
ncbi:MAG: CapA family protein [Oscillospiraceae bacterium]|nr:CapA family protein [Oscillospiraceae bacterium]